VERAEAALARYPELELHSRAADDLATLAATYLATGDTAQAVEYARQALVILDASGEEGPESPSRDYFICYQALAAGGHTERARAVLRSGYDLVQARADRITDLVLRKAFLEQVQANRDIVREYERAMGDA
jgi:hypothetical protein